jgi:hypothetical protein
MTALPGQSGAIRAAVGVVPRLYGIADTTSRTSMPGGEYGLGSQLES